MYVFGFGYLGAAIARSLAQFVMTVSMIIVLIYNGYLYFFIPHSVSTIWNKKGIYQYISLAIPGIFQTAFEWIIEEMAVILSGYVIQPQIALSSVVILCNVFNVMIVSFSVAVCNGTNLRVAKYIGYGSIYDAKRSAKVGICLGFVIIFITSLIFVLGRNVIPKIFTNDRETIDLTSEMIIFLMVLSFGCILLQTVGGIYRGLGQQKIAAIIVCVSYWIISLPIAFVLLFVYGFKDDLFYGVAIIVGELTLGNILSAIGTVVYLLCFVDWNKAVDQSSMRVKSTMRDYHSTKVFDGKITELP